MSTNLKLNIERVVYTKSGKEYIQNYDLPLRQTPTKVTFEIIPLSTFEEQLDAYCQWADSLEESEDERLVFLAWEPICDYGIGPKEGYFTLNNEYWPDRDLEYFVEKVVMKGEPEFETIHTMLQGMYIYEDLDKGFTLIGYRKTRKFPHSHQLKNKIDKLKKEEYDISFQII